MKKLFSKKTLLIIFFIALFLLPASQAIALRVGYSFISTAQASIFDAISGNMGIFNQGAELPTKSGPDPVKTIIINIINTALSFLALIFVVLVLYAGFLYMTAGGTAKNVEKAQNILKDAVIGLAIIFASYVIVNFVITTIIDLAKGS